MYRNLLLAGCAALILTSCQGLRSGATLKKKRESKQEMLEDLLAFERERAMDPATGNVESQRLKAAWEYAQVLRSSQQGNSRAPISNVTWQERGPNNVGGRTRAMLYDMNDPTLKTVWAGSVGGGIWKSTDITQANPNWVKVNDFFDNIAVTYIAQHPVNYDTMYFSTGEGWGNSDAIRGLGIWRTTDGGNNWAQLASTNNSSFHYVQKVMVHPSGDVYAATRTGLYKSTNHGSTWTEVLGSGVGGGGSDNACEIEFGADGDVYAAFGIGSAGSIWKSDFQTHGAATGNLGNWSNITPAGSYQRIELACSPSNANILYAVCASGSGGTPLIRKSINQGASWTNCASAGFCDQGSFNTDFTRSQYWYDLIAAVSPNNPATLFIGGVDALRSTDSGATWTQITSWTGGASGACSAPNVYVHADHHAIVFKPGSSTEVLWGTDGGVFRSTDAGNTFTEKNLGYNVTQYYASDIHPLQTNFFIAGAQDNGSHRLTTVGLGEGVPISGGDGAYCHINQVDPTYQLTSYVYANYFFSNDGGQSFQSMGGGSNTGRFINPTDLADSTNVLYGAHGGGVYEVIQNMGTTNNRSTRSVSGVVGTTRRLSAVKVDPNNSNTVWMGYSNSSLSIDVIKVNNAASATPLVNDRTGNLPATNGFYLAGIDVQEGDSNHVIVCISNYGANSIWESTNGGSTWTSVEGNLPDIPVRCVMFHPDSSDMAIIGTDLGVWSTNNLNGGSTQWSQTNSGLANTRVENFRFRRSDYTLLAATHGRGLFTAILPHTPRLNFSQTNLNVTEQTQASVNCRGFRDYNVDLKCSFAPTGPVNATVGVALGNAVAGLDYAFTTNGSFTTPSALCVFNPGTTTIPVTVRIYDDADYETQTDSLVLNYVINSGSAFQGLFNTCKIRITDNSDNPTLQRKVLWSENFESGVNPPAGWTFSNPNTNRWANRNYVCSTTLTNYSMQIYNNGNNGCGYNNSATSTATVRRPVNATGYTNLQVSFDWVCEGEPGFDYGQLVYSTNTVTPSWTVVPGSPTFVAQANPSSATVNLPASLNNTTFLLGWRWINDASVGNIPMGFDNVVVTGDTARFIENTLTSKANYLGPFGEAYFYHSDGDVLARIENLTAHDYGCTTVEIDRAGTGAQFLPGEVNVLKKVFDKGFKVTPTTNNPSGQYRITFYVTNAEKNGFETEGRTWNSDANLVKMPVSVNLATTATLREYATNQSKNTFLNGYSITGEFGTGFSGFALGNPGSLALPLNLLSFNASWQGADAVLDWNTANEENVRDFTVERSSDGQTFSTLATVMAKNLATADYSYTDRLVPPGVSSVYYRLKMTDLDSKYSYSPVAMLNRSQAGSTSVYPNPVSDELTLNLGSGASIDITDSKGSRLYQATLGAGVHRIPVGAWAPGVYYLRNTKSMELIRIEKR